jgi:predicted DNA-binding transcriptional regulator YafY
MGRSYRITNLDHDTVKTERTIDVIERKRKYITAYCHLRNATRTFMRSRIKEIVPAYSSLGIQESRYNTVSPEKCSSTKGRNQIRKVTTKRRKKPFKFGRYWKNSEAWIKY